jgi:DNA ligase (NAD+)
MTESASTEARELEALIRKHQDLYYNGQPEISDAEFDSLWDRLAELDPSSPVLARVGADSQDGFAKARHVMPMGSQAKATNPDEFLKWAAKSGHGTFLAQHKLDGASLELQYARGAFVKAVTRGDGETGDDISANARRMSGFVAELPDYFTGAVRCEVLMSREIHRARHAEKANCRNAANGIMKRKDGIGAEDLDLVAYDALETGRPGFFAREGDKLAWLAAAGFKTVECREFTRAEDIVAYRDTLAAKRPELAYDIDGIVVKGQRIDPTDMARARPEFQIAFKFEPEEAVSRLVGVEWSESGATYTPIGVIEPVSLAGTTVRRANLCNPGLIRDMGLRLGALVAVSKRGEIIPKIERLIELPEGSVPIPQPESCGSCGRALVDEGSSLYCPNPSCPKRARHRLGKWVATLNLMDFGEALLDRLFTSGIAHDISSLYRLDEEALMKVDRMGPVIAKKLVKELKSKRDIELATFVAGFDIDGVGETVARKIVDAGFGSIESLKNARADELSSIPGLGEIMARKFREGFDAVYPEMRSLLDSGAIRVSEAAGGALMGKSFCFTGELRSMRRADAEGLAKSFGATVKSSVTKDLSFLVASDATTGKARKAAEYGVKVIGEDEFLAMVGKGGAS